MEFFCISIRGIIIESGHHNFDYLIPPEKYRKEHPEFFAENEQTRQQRLAGMPPESRQLCTTNAALREELVKNLLEYRKKYPELQYLALNPNDGFGWCECSECSRFYDKDLKGNVYSLSEKYYKADRIFHDLIQAVNAGIREKAPDIILNFFAYINYTSPAPGFRLLPGMGVHLALYWRCINHDIDCEKCGINSGYYQDILAWEKVKNGGLFNIYEYFMGINFYLGMPMLHFESMFREFDFYHAHKVDGVFTQFWPGHWTVYGPNYYFMAKAARGEDAEEAISGFYRKRFGKMEKVARRFYGKIREILHSMSDCHIPHCIAFLSRVSLGDLEALRSDGEALAANCPELPGRACGIWVEYMCRFKKIYEDSKLRPTSRETVEEFLEWIHANKEAKIFVTAKFDQFFGEWFEDIAAGRNWHYFTENDWFTEYSRRKIVPR